jgi:hypothetical protein
MPKKSKFKEVVINVCHGGYGLSDAAYEELIRLGVPVREYIKEERGEDGLIIRNPANEGIVIFDSVNSSYHRGRYWDAWTRDNREHPVVIQAIKKIGTKKASSFLSKLKIVKIPVDVEYTIEEYDGCEHIAEVHRTWR